MLINPIGVKNLRKLSKLSLCSLYTVQWVIHIFVLSFCPTSFTNDKKLHFSLSIYRYISFIFLFDRPSFIKVMINELLNIANIHFYILYINVQYILNIIIIVQFSFNKCMSAKHINNGDFDCQIYIYVKRTLKRRRKKICKHCKLSYHYWHGRRPPHYFVFFWW